MPYRFLSLLMFTLRADELEIVTRVEAQPLLAQAARVAQALELAGEPLPAATLKEIESLPHNAQGVERLQKILDAYCIAGIHINPEARVKVQQGPAAPRLVEQGWRTFLVKVHNEAGITPILQATSPQAGNVYNRNISVARTWTDLSFFNKPPMRAFLSGLEVEYRVLQMYAREAGKREAKLVFDAGQGTQDLGFRNEVDILFQVAPVAQLKFKVMDAGKPAIASFLIRDAQGRVYPSQSKRIAPDFFFQKHIYRADGEAVHLPPGKYTIEYSRGPEYRPVTKTIEMTSQAQTFEATLERWIDPSKSGWISGDHHIHAAGCSHYEKPTEGVYPKDMIRHVMGEDIKIGSVLTWGPGWYFQKTFNEGKDNALSNSDYRMRYDVEVSGHPSSHTGHLVLLGMKETDYPGKQRIEDWPSWGMPILKWARSQGAITGYAHTGWGLQIPKDEVLTKELPPFDGIGANEYVVAVTHGLVDFISTVDTPWPWELNVWYHTLNAGYRTRISGETDFPCIYDERVGLGRSYVKQVKADYADWIQGVKEGRNYVSDGRSHLMDFAVNGRAVGKGPAVAMGPLQVTVNAAAMLGETPDPVVKGKTASEKPYWHVERARIAGTRKVPVELIVNGVAVAKQELEADGKVRALTFAYTPTESSWVALRILGSSHTNPIWVGEGEVRVKDSIDWCIRAVQKCKEQKIGRVRLEEQGEMLNAYDAALREYRRRVN
ncbi:hypothetical protein F183_A04040 [Bryobacterales bacterium F-183]|nr:hypothetical protein F183_A04040 [Bryobacterales bacterium F-183]